MIKIFHVFRDQIYHIYEPRLHNFASCNEENIGLMTTPQKVREICLGNTGTFSKEYGWYVSTELTSKIFNETPAGDIAAMWGSSYTGVDGRTLYSLDEAARMD